MRRIFLLALAIGLALVCSSPVQAQGPVKPPVKALQALPDAAAIKQAEALARDLFKDDIAEVVKKPEKGVALATRLRGEALKPQSDAAGQFALFGLATTSAAMAGDLSLTFAIIDDTAKVFRTDPLAEKAKVLPKLGEAHHSEAQNSNMVDQVEALVDQAIAADRYDVADPAAQQAQAAAQRAGDMDQMAQATARLANVHQLAGAYSNAKAAIVVLAEQASDPPANMTVGKYYCFLKGDWSAGLPYLGKCGDEKIASQAKKDLAGANDPKDQAALADGWWALAEFQSAPALTQIRHRAAYWYQKALPKLEGLDKMKVEKRLEALAAADEPTYPTAVTAATVNVLSDVDFQAKLAEAFPLEKNLARKGGKVTESSQYSPAAPSQVLGGQRADHAWLLAKPTGYLEVSWDPSLVGRYVVLFTRTSISHPNPRGGRDVPATLDKWGAAQLRINDGNPIALNGVQSNKVVVIDLGRMTKITSLRIDIHGEEMPGMSGLEVHKRMLQ